MANTLLAITTPKPNGERLVLVHRDHGYQPYVSWRRDEFGNNYFGHYHCYATEAWRGFEQRVKDAGLDGYSEPNTEE